MLFIGMIIWFYRTLFKNVWTKLKSPSVSACLESASNPPIRLQRSHRTNNQLIPQPKLSLNNQDTTNTPQHQQISWRFPRPVSFKAMRTAIFNQKANRQLSVLQPLVIFALMILRLLLQLNNCSSFGPHIHPVTDSISIFHELGSRHEFLINFGSRLIQNLVRLQDVLCSYLNVVVFVLRTE